MIAKCELESFKLNTPQCTAKVNVYIVQIVCVDIQSGRASGPFRGV